VPEVKATLVPDLITPCSAVEFMVAVRSGLETLTGKTPSREQVAILTAQCALESGRWKSMHRNNPGNIKASAEYEYLYTQFRCNEVIHGRVEWFDPPHPQTNFRAYYDLETGVLDYLRFLSGRKRYASAWAAAARGDVVGFVRALKAGGYFTADEAPYLRAVVSLFNEYLRMLNDPARDTEPPPDTQNDAQAVMILAPDPERLLHTQAVQAMALGLDLAMEGVREERNRNLRED
jgi:hypothetical protein